MSSKIARVLEVLLARGDQGLNRWEAQSLAHDTVLPSSISALHKRGVVTHAEIEEVPGFAGHVTRLARYTIPAGERDRARAVLEAMTAKRKPTAATAGQGSGRDRQAHVQAR